MHLVSSEPNQCWTNDGGDKHYHCIVTDLALLLVLLDLFGNGNVRIAPLESRRPLEVWRSVLSSHVMLLCGL